MSDQIEFPVGAQVWARMQELSKETQSYVESDTEVLSWVVGHERRGNMLYYQCKAPESGGIWTSDNDEVVSGVFSVRSALTQGARFELDQTVHVKKRVEWQNTEGGEVQKSGRVIAAWCKKVQGAEECLLEYSYWIELENRYSRIRNWYPQEDLE